MFECSCGEEHTTIEAAKRCDQCHLTSLAGQCTMVTDEAGKVAWLMPQHALVSILDHKRSPVTDPYYGKCSSEC